MNTDQLVAHIVNELYKKLQDTPTTVTPKKRAVLLPKHKVVPHKLLEEQYQFIDSCEATSGTDLVILSELSIGLMSQIALGIGESEEARIVLECLLKGKPVYVLEQGISYRQYKSTAHRTLYSLYSDYENKIKQYGVRMIHDVVEILTDLRPEYHKIQQIEQVEMQEPVAGASVNLLSKKVILESDLTRAAIQGVVEVTIKKNAIITPLAQDYMRAHHLVIKRI